MEPVREASRCVSYGSDQRQEKLTEPCKEKLAEENDDLSLVLQFKSNPLGFKSERLKGKRLSSKSADFKSENAVKSEMSRLLFSIKESERWEKPTNQFAAALPTMQCRVTIEPKEHRPLSESNDWAEVQRKEAILKRTASRGEKRSIASVTDSNYCNRRKMQKVGGSTRPTKQPGLHKDIKDNVKRARKLSLQGKVRTLPFLSKEQPEDSVGNDSGDVEEGQKKPKPKDKDLEVEDMEVDQENSCQKECTFTSQQGSTGLLSEVANLTSGMAGLSVSPQKQKMEPVREASRCVSYGSDQRQEKLTEPCKEKLAEEHDDTSLVLQFKSNPLGFKSERLKEKRLSSKRVDNSRNIIDNNPIINSNLNSRHQISSSDNNYNESCSDNMNETMSHDCHVSQKFGKASLYISTSWKQIIDSCPKQGKGKLIEIMKLLNVEGDGNAKLSDSECGQLLDHLKAFPIEFLEDISVLVYPHLYKLQSEIIHDYDGLSRVPEGYLIYLPPEAAGLEPFQSSTLGNCLWCSLSIVLQGDEHCQNQLRLGAAVATLCNMKAFTKHISVQFCSSDEALAWAGTVAARDEIFTPLLGLQSPSDIISGVISEEIKETLKNFSYSGLFQVVMAAQFLQREIRQYCCKPGADHYNSAVTPLIYTDPTESHRLKPVNILWVPAKLGEDTYNHIVPLLPCRPLPQNSRRVLAKKGVKNNDFVS